MKNAKVWLLLLATIVMLTGCNQTTVVQSEENRENIVPVAESSNENFMELRGRNLSVRLRYGMDGCVKYDRYMKISAEITNHGGDFSGWIQMLLPVNEENSMYRKGFQISQGEKKTLEMFFPCCMSQNQAVFSVHRQDGEEICSKAFALNLIYGTDTAYLGVYSDKEQQFRYLQGKSTRVFSLADEDFCENEKALDILDVIIISDKDVSDFTRRQTRSLISWVKSGGLLVIADSGKHREFQAFTDKDFSCKIDRSRKIHTSFGLSADDYSLIEQRMTQKLESKKAEQVRTFLKENLSAKLYEQWRSDISNIQDNLYCLDESGEIFSYLREYYEEDELKKNLSMSATDEEKMKIKENLEIPVLSCRLQSISMGKSEDVLTDENHNLILQKKALGLGNIMVSGCSLALDEKYWDVIGNEILEQVKENLSQKKKQQLLMERQQSHQYENYIYEQGLLVTETDRLPNLKLYAVILIVYILFSGPVLFVLLRKQGKSMLLWGLIPSVSILFSVFIYLIGTSTRIQNPYINYLSHLQLQGGGQAVLDTCFRLTSGQNTPYQMVLKENCDIEPLVTVQSFDENSASEIKSMNTDYQYGIEYGNDETKISMEELSAFEGKNFQNEEVVRVEGDVETEISSNNMKLQGTVTNTFSYDLEDCFLYDSGTVYYLGTIPSGKSVSLDELDSDKIYLQNEYNYDYDILANQIFGTNFWGTGKETDCEVQRRAVLAEAYLEQQMNSQTSFFGFATGSSQPENKFVNKISFAHYGVMGISKQVDVKYTFNGMELLPDISQYAFSFDNSVTDGKVIKDKTQNRIEISYRLPKGYRWKGLVYNQSNNAEFSYYNNGYLSSAIFAGKVTMVDRKTGQEIEIIQSGRETKRKISAADVNEDGVLTLYYYTDNSTGNELQLPNIMVSVMKKKG